MKNILIIIIVILFLVFLFATLGRSDYVPIFKKIKGNETVGSIAEKLQSKVYKRLEKKLTKLGLTSFPSEIVIYAFKEEKLLEVYVKLHNKLHMLKSYKFTNFSGELGPKLKEGDKQIPEGIYKIDYLNPNSSFYLSMKVNYPNSFDKEKGKLDGRSNLGSDIFIHGKRSTIGCIPVGDDAIEELFILSKHAILQGIEVVISPRDFRNNFDEPEITSVNWSGELYQDIKHNLNKNF